MATETFSAPDLTARLIAHGRRKGGSSSQGGVKAVGTAFHLLSAELSRWMGADGCQALLKQAMRKAQADHPALSGVGIVSGPHPQLDRFAERVEEYGGKEIAAGLEAALVALFELLSRMMGDDLSTKIAEMSMTNEVNSK